MAKILMVDDDEFLPKTLGMMLIKVCAHEIIFAPDGQKGLESLLRNPGVEIILCDYNMPILNGYLFCKEVKTNDKYKPFSHIPIIGIGDFPEDQRTFLAEFKQKPIGFTELDECIRQYCP